MPAPSDENLLDFDTNRLANWDEQHARRLLAGDDAVLYRNHLAIAKWIDGWAETLGKDNDEDPDSYSAGFEKGVREIAAHLRQGDYVPGGAFMLEGP
ncbi:hypothetical protein [Actinomadura sp. K4S16]|uniref:hypothetical protein n=1 Tax=Actinomadura sp. K4S16 TaxID=1316147 RepID=UPI0011F0271C|nr:hypothetical protein [Actinomadura sp. K4S16]